MFVLPPYWRHPTGLARRRQQGARPSCDHFSFPLAWPPNRAPTWGRATCNGAPSSLSRARYCLQMGARGAGALPHANEAPLSVRKQSDLAHWPEHCCRWPPNRFVILASGRARLPAQCHWGQLCARRCWWAPAGRPLGPGGSLEAGRWPAGGAAGACAQSIPGQTANNH